MEKRNLTKSSMSAAGHDAPDPLFVQLFSIFPRCNLTEEQQTLVDNLRMTSGTLGAETDTEYYQEISAYPEFSDMPRKLEIVNVLPFSNHDNTHLMSFAAFYAFLFIVGTCGNASIIAIINHLRETSRKAKDNSTMIYIWVLCLVDFAAMLPLPMTIMDQVLGFWMFGTAACKLFRLLEHIGKIFSTFILVALSVDRYFAVCHPVYTQIRAKRTVYGILLSLFALTFTLLGPMLYYAHSKELILRQKVNEHTQQLIQMRIFKCVDNLNDKLFVVFTLYIFVLAYVAPLLLMVLFYYSMIRRLFAQSKGKRKGNSRSSTGSNTMRNGTNRSEEHIPIRRIAIYTMAICTFHFVCWTPYWVSVLYSLYLEKSDRNRAIPSHAFIYFMYGVHALPYINSACNWVLYGLLNKQLHQSAVHETTVCHSREERRSRTSRSTNGDIRQPAGIPTYVMLNKSNGKAANGLAHDLYLTEMLSEDKTLNSENNSPVSTNANSPFLGIRQLSGRSQSMSAPIRNGNPSKGKHCDSNI